ncbi:hypothetical protein DTO021D3_3445 [Paecilomyces variotii]|nr:hypothetical protein DTO032I3_6529 [Paecilomyces variotii]KAJ9279654.1 hypothetical protein DTO021D3_3445 [Paecilomyces variotii]KAJ9347409.1 hypothetical protein DTO027B6_283 [Paecilomyces variotii]KAJ9358706.1 hypothetical protein DTO027B9_2379 [Paecilomyces variotii]KAJ9384981.1 hypothetical protein DTO032I4_4374 [Paecilomyces variotii]
MSTWTSLPTTSCVHKYASGCLLPTQSICCFCADYCSSSSAPGYLPILDERTRTAYNSTRYAKYCWKCQEYWGARHASQFRPASLATSNLTANLPEIHSRSLHSDPRSQAAAFAGSGIPSVPGGSQRSLYPRCNNITALREELQAINTGIARALCSLQDLGSQLSSYRSLQSVQGIMPSANMETVQPAGLNNTDPQISTEQNAYNTEMWNQAHNTAHRTSISTAPSETPNNAEETQNGNAPRVMAPFWTGVNGPSPAPVSQQSTTTSTSAGPGTESGNNETPTHGASTHEWRPAVANSWAEYNRIETHRRSQAQTATQVLGVPTLYANNHQAYQHMAGTLQQLGPHFVPPGYSLVPQASFGYASPAETQHASSYRLPPLAYPRANPHVALPRPEISSSVAQQRGHESQSSDGNITIGSGANPPQNLNSRRRARRPDDPGFQHSRRPSPPQYEGIATQPTNAQFAEMPGPVPVPAAGTYVSYPALTAHQHALITRQIQMNSVLRAMRPEDVEALRMYEEGIARGRRFHTAHTAAEEPPSKGLDNQNDGRPEPKEAEEMNVSLECKVCLSQLVDTVLIPCGHAVLCRWCANQHMPSSRADHTRPKKPAACPMCRKPVKQKFRIYLS